MSHLFWVLDAHLKRIQHLFPNLDRKLRREGEQLDGKMQSKP